MSASVHQCVCCAKRADSLTRNSCVFPLRSISIVCSLARSLPPSLPPSRLSLALSFASQADIKKVQAAAKLAKKHIEAGSNKLAHQLAKWTHGSKHAKASK